MSPGAELIVSCSLAAAGFASVVFLVFVLATDPGQGEEPAECPPLLHRPPAGEVFML